MSSKEIEESIAERLRTMGSSEQTLQLWKEIVQAFDQGGGRAVQWLVQEKIDEIKRRSQEALASLEKRLTRSQIRGKAK